MLWILTRKEILAHVLSFRIAIALLFTMVLAVLTTLIGSEDYSRSMESYQKEKQRVEKSLDQVTVFSQVQPKVVVPADPLSILGRGLLGTSGQMVFVLIDYIPVAANGISGGSNESQFVKVLVQIDFTTVVALLFSFLAIVLGFDGICGERQSGTLVQVLANPVLRAEIVFAKLLGGAFSLLLPFAVAFGISLLIITGNIDVVLQVGHWVRLVLFFVVSCLFLLQIFSLSLMVSCFSREPEIALIFCLLAWLVGGVGYMSTLPSFSRYSIEEKGYQKLVEKRIEIDGQFNSDLSQWREAHPPPSDAYMVALERNGYVRFGHLQGYEWRQQFNAFAIEKELELAEAKRKAAWENWSPLAEEANLVEKWSVISPFSNFRVLSYKIARTTLDDRFYLTRAVNRYRDSFIAYLRGKDAFASRRWFSDDPIGHEPIFRDPDTMDPDLLRESSPFFFERLNWAEMEDRKINNRRGRSLDLSDMPKFNGDWQSLGTAMDEIVAGLVVILLMLGASVLITIQRFLHCDPR